jgi:thiol-disulfide isomerase/thioredoxin
MAKKRRTAHRAAAPDQAPPDAKKERRIQAQEERRRALRNRSRARALRRAGGIAAGLAFAAGVLFAIVRGSTGGVAFAGDIRAGGTLKSLKVPSLQGGESINYDQFRSKPLVLNFFASWCPNCVGEMPGFQQVHQQLGSKVDFLGVSQSDAKSASIALANQTGVHYPLGIDANGDFFRATGSTGMPTTLFIRAGGQIAYIQVGALDPASLKQAIQQYFGVST